MLERKFRRGEYVFWKRGRCQVERAIFIEMTSKHNCTIVTERGMLAQALAVDLTLEEPRIDVESCGKNKTDPRGITRLAG